MKTFPLLALASSAIEHHFVWYLEVLKFDQLLTSPVLLLLLTVCFKHNSLTKYFRLLFKER